MERHISVLTAETIEGLALTQNSIVIDCTLGSGGHAEAILAKLGREGRYIGIDADQTAIDALPDLIRRDKRVTLVCDNFRNIAAIVRDVVGTAPTAILADLGWRMEQFTDATRGFSLKNSGPLVMTYGDPTHYPFTAHDIANEWEEESIADIIFGYGEERFARRIASAIVAARDEGEIRTSEALAEIVSRAMPRPFRYGRIHPATKTFQAFRIAVNDELGALKQLLSDGYEALAPSGRMAIISFHSLEDRIVKHYFQHVVHEQNAVPVTKKPCIASPQELEENPRARSAKLRIIEKH